MNDLMMELLTDYGNYRTRKFTDVWNDEPAFTAEYKKTAFYKMWKAADDSLQVLYYLLYSRYGNNTVGSSDENQFKYQIFSTMAMYGGAWEKRKEVQEEVRELTLEDFTQGTFMIYNHAFNNGSELKEKVLPGINEQSTSDIQYAKPKALADALALVLTDVTESFLDEFKRYFITVVTPQCPLWYK